jgi:hypothetical protein
MDSRAFEVVPSHSLVSQESLNGWVLPRRVAVEGYARRKDAR